MKPELAGKVTIVTGGGRGIGLGITRRLAAAGARVVVAQRDAMTGVEAVRRVCEAGGQAVFLATDVSRPEDVQRLISETNARLGSPEILVNNAAITGCYDPFLTLTVERWRQVIDVNLTGAFLCSQAAARLMADKGGGKIVNVSSVGGIAPEPDCSHYCAAKGGLISLTKSMAMDLARYNIQVNCVAPGPISTRPGLESTPAGQHSLAKVPAGRFGTVEEVAEVVAYLVGPQSDYTTGQVVAVDGGYLLT